MQCSVAFLNCTFFRFCSLLSILWMPMPINHNMLREYSTGGTYLMKWKVERLEVFSLCLRQIFLRLSSFVCSLTHQWNKITSYTEIVICKLDLHIFSVVSLLKKNCKSTFSVENIDDFSLWEKQCSFSKLHVFSYFSSLCTSNLNEYLD